MAFIQDRGTVVGCLFADIHEEPDKGSKVLTQIPMLTEVMIDMNESTDKYYKIFTETSPEGYCFKKFIALPRE